MFSLKFKAASRAELVAAMLAFVSVGDFTTDAIAAEFKERMAQDGKVVRVIPFSAETGAAPPPSPTNAQPAAPATGDKPAKRGRKKAAEAQVVAPVPQADPTPAAHPSPDTAPAEATDDFGGDEATADNSASITVDDVRAKLDEHKNLCGMVTTRAVLAEEIGANVKLIDVPKEKLPEVHARFTREINSAKKARL